MRRYGAFRGRIWPLVLVAVVAAAAARAVAADDDGRDLVKRVFDAAPKTPFVAKLMLSSEGGLTRELEVRHKRIGDAEVSYMEVTAPLDVKDTRFLFFDRVQGRDEQYIYLPAMKRSLQVADEMRKQPFLGSEFYVSDLVTPELDAFTYTIVGEKKVGDASCKLVEVTPRVPKNELYSKARVAIDPAALVVMQTEFFDLKGKPLKVWTIGKLEKIDGFWTPLEQRMTNVQEKRSSTFTTTQIRYNVELPDSVFTRTYLTH